MAWSIPGSVPAQTTLTRSPADRVRPPPRRVHKPNSQVPGWVLDEITWTRGELGWQAEPGSGPRGARRKVRPEPAGNYRDAWGVYARPGSASPGLPARPPPLSWWVSPRPARRRYGAPWRLPRSCAERATATRS